MRIRLSECRRPPPYFSFKGLKDANEKRWLVVSISLGGCLDADEMAHFIGHASDCRANMQQSATPIEYDTRGFPE